jgi:hypothetical protein
MQVTSDYSFVVNSAPAHNTDWRNAKQITYGAQWRPVIIIIIIIIIIISSSSSSSSILVGVTLGLSH